MGAYASAYGPIDLKQYGWAGHMDQQSCDNCLNAQDAHLVFPLVAASPLGYWRDDINPLNWIDSSTGAITGHNGGWNQEWMGLAHTNGVNVILCSTANVPPFYSANWFSPPYTALCNWFAYLAVNFPGVDALEVFNEPNNTLNYLPGYPSVIGNITEAVAKAVHAANPKMKVLLGADQGPNVFTQIPLCPDVDGIATHPYDNDNVNYGPPETVYERTSTTDFATWIGMLRQAAPGKSIWITEQAGHSNDGESSSAYWFVRRLIECIQQHVEHAVIYQFGSGDSMQSSMDYTLSPRQNWFMLQRLESAIQGLYLRDWPVTASAPPPNFSSAVFDIWSGDGSFPYRTSLCVWNAGYMQARNATQYSNPTYTTNLQVHHPSAQDVVALNLVTGETWRPTWVQSGTDVVIQNAEVNASVIVYQIYNQRQ